MPPTRLSGWWLFCLVLIPTLVLAHSLEHVDHKHWTREYDGLFRKYAKHYFGAGYDWRWFKAQGIAESGLQKDANSRAGAIGLMQILPSTFEEIRSKNPHFTAIEEPKWNIAAGIYYDRQLYRRWVEHVPPSERLSFAFGSYNAGFGNIRKAYRKALREGVEVQRWSELEHMVPGQTRHYVRRIHRLMGKGA